LHFDLCILIIYSLLRPSSLHFIKPPSNSYMFWNLIIELFGCLFVLFPLLQYTKNRLVLSNFFCVCNKIVSQPIYVYGIINVSLCEFLRVRTSKICGFYIYFSVKPVASIILCFFWSLSVTIRKRIIRVRKILSVISLDFVLEIE
jgi:hypothetical protein